MKPALSMSNISLVQDGRAVLTDIDLTVEPDQRWVILGRNGSGKTTLLKIASLYLHPTSGTVEILGHRLGRVDIRKLRPMVGFTSTGFIDLLRPELTARDIVMTAKYGALEPWWHKYTDADSVKAIEHLTKMGVGHLAEKSLKTLSSGERQRVLLARTLMTDPTLILLDEPTAALDLAGREELILSLSNLATDRTSPATVLVTHHVEEIPEGFTHVLLMLEGSALVSGRIQETLSADNLSECFGVPVILEQHGGRWTARSRQV